MSISPDAKQDEGIKIGIVDKTTNVAKKTLTKYFEDPIHYIFYTTLAFTFVGLLLGRSFSWQLYGILALLGLLKLCAFTIADKDTISMDFTKPRNE